MYTTTFVDGRPRGLFEACREEGIQQCRRMHNYTAVCPAVRYARRGKVCEDARVDCGDRRRHPTYRDRPLRPRVRASS